MSDTPPTATSETNVVATPRQQRQMIEEDDPFDEDRQWDFDDISSLGQAEIDAHREARHYARVVAYEMPRLASNYPIFPPTGGSNSAL